MAEPERLTPTEQQILLQVARASVHAKVLGQVYRPPVATGALAHASGAFVTLRLAGELRGCIGHIEGDRPLVESVARSAAAAATEDPRFAPLDVRELTRIHLEISVLGPLERFSDPQEIELGRHGIVIESGPTRGLLLPQVAIEWRWDSVTFVSQTCVKAGLSPDAWRRGATLYRFAAEIFGEPPATMA